MLGTGFPASQVLLVEQPGGWGPGGLLESRFDPAVARRLMNSLGRKGIRVLAVRRPGRVTAPARRRWALADCRPSRRAMRWGRFDQDAELLNLNPDLDMEPVTPTPTYLVCAHGTHDVCCAVEGRSVAAELDRLRPGNAWECSHLGGDRFAANVLVLPSGVMYGRFPVVAAADLVAASDRGEVLPPYLRGRIGLAPAAQAALSYAQERLQVFGIDQLQVLGTDAVHQVSPAARNADEVERVRVRIAAPDGIVVVWVRVELVPAELLTCRAARASRSLAYRPVSVEVH
jgi:hypothetical protein